MFRSESVRPLEKPAPPVKSLLFLLWPVLSLNALLEKLKQLIFVLFLVPVKVRFVQELKGRSLQLRSIVNQPKISLIVVVTRH